MGPLLPFLNCFTPIQYAFKSRLSVRRAIERRPFLIERGNAFNNPDGPIPRRMDAAFRSADGAISCQLLAFTGLLTR
jgi:hypothetical protein